MAGQELNRRGRAGWRPGLSRALRAGVRCLLAAALVALVASTRVSPVACIETCGGSSEARCVGDDIQACSSEHDAWLEPGHCKTSKWPGGTCVSLDPTHTFCSLAPGPIPECAGHAETCLNGERVACRNGYATYGNDPCLAGTCVLDARGEARCMLPPDDGGTDAADADTRDDASADAPSGE